METPLFFKNNGYNLFGVLHEPESNEGRDLNKQNLGMVFIYPFAEERISSHRVMVNFARYLVKRGISIFRFDFMGHGDSDGYFEDATVETRLSDIEKAIKYFKHKTAVNKVGLLGVRFGASLSALYAKHNEPVDFLVLINPIIKGGQYMDQCLRSNLATQMATYHKIERNRNLLIDDLARGKTVNIDGYLLTKELYFEIKNIDLTRQASCKSNHILIIQVSKRAKNTLDRNVQHLHELYLENNCVSEICSIHCDTFWVESRVYVAETLPLYRRVLEWAQKIYI